MFDVVHSWYSVNVSFLHFFSFSLPLLWYIKIATKSLQLFPLNDGVHIPHNLTLGWPFNLLHSMSCSFWVLASSDLAVSALALLECCCHVEKPVLAWQTNEGDHLRTASLRWASRWPRAQSDLKQDQQKNFLDVPSPDGWPTESWTSTIIVVVGTTFWDGLLYSNK